MSVIMIANSLAPTIPELSISDIAKGLTVIRANEKTVEFSIFSGRYYFDVESRDISSDYSGDVNVAFSVLFHHYQASFQEPFDTAEVRLTETHHCHDPSEVRVEFSLKEWNAFFYTPSCFTKEDIEAKIAKAGNDLIKYPIFLEWNYNVSSYAESIRRKMEDTTKEDVRASLRRDLMSITQMLKKHGITTCVHQVKRNEGIFIIQTKWLSHLLFVLIPRPFAIQIDRNISLEPFRSHAFVARLRWSLRGQRLDSAGLCVAKTNVRLGRVWRDSGYIG